MIVVLDGKRIDEFLEISKTGAMQQLMMKFERLKNKRKVKEMPELEQIELFSINKIAWLKAHNANEIDRKIHVNKDKKGKDKYVVSYVFAADEKVNDLLLEYKYSEELQDFLRTFRAVNSEIFCEIMNFRENQNKGEVNKDVEENCEED
jgi:hypothetical protein